MSINTFEANYLAKVNACLATSTNLATVTTANAMKVARAKAALDEAIAALEQAKTNLKKAENDATKEIAEAHQTFVDATNKLSKEKANTPSVPPSNLPVQKKEIVPTKSPVQKKELVPTKSEKLPNLCNDQEECPYTDCRYAHFSECPELVRKNPWIQLVSELSKTDLQHYACFFDTQNKGSCTASPCYKLHIVDEDLRATVQEFVKRPQTKMCNYGSQCTRDGCNFLH
jgi:hypothetical protein